MSNGADKPLDWVGVLQAVEKPFQSEPHEVTVTETQVPSNTEQLCLDGATAGQPLGFTVGAFPGMCVGGAVGGLVWPPLAGLGLLFGWPSTRSAADTEEADNKNPFVEVDAPQEHRDMWMRRLRDATAHGAATGAEIGGITTGAIVALPCTILGGLFGAGLGMFYDISLYCRSEKTDVPSTES
mmetsp:Transcript_34118/g.91013  ORF Transcript_34118/g.91013 Transcript_34118/m.91013 type:complete len:183 (-) Transcript_34118:178-726(-)